MTEPHEPEDTPTHAEGEHPSSGTDWTSSPAEPPTEPGWARNEAPAPGGGAETGATAAEPVAGPPRQRWWRSHRVRVGAVGTLAALVLLGGGFGAGYAVAGASAPTQATHATTAAAKAHPRKGTAPVRRKRQSGQQNTAPQQGTAPQQNPAPQQGTVTG